MSKHLTPPRFCRIKRIKESEAKNYTKLFPNEIEKAVGFTLTPTKDGWEDVTYYGEK
jgi:hypothetical protein